MFKTQKRLWFLCFEMFPNFHEIDLVGLRTIYLKTFSTFFRMTLEERGLARLHRVLKKYFLFLASWHFAAHKGWKKEALLPDFIP